MDKSYRFSEKNGQKYKEKTTAGWNLEIEWKDNSTSWLPLSYLKKDEPLDVARYEVDNQISNELAFDWWAQEVLKRASRLISESNPKR